MALNTDYLTKTTKVLHVYADGTSGDDANTGESGSPVKTITKLISLLPEVISDATVLHMGGAFDLSSEPSSYVYLRRELVNNASITIDGGDGVEEAAPGSTGLSITSSTTTSVTSTGAGWTVDEWKGFWVKTSTGQVRTIHSNTADTLYPCNNFSPAPTGTLDIVQPTTTITRTANGGITISCFGNGVGHVQRLRFTDKATLTLSGTAAGGTYASGIYSTTNSAFACRVASQGSYLGLNKYIWDPASPDGLLALWSVGVTVMPGEIIATGPGALQVFSMVSTKLTIRSDIEAFYAGCNFGAMELDGASISGTTVSLGYPFSDQKVTIDGSVGSGLTIRNVKGVVRLASNKWDIKNCGSHGIEVINSSLLFEGGISGSGNAGAGVYAHNGSTVITKAGTAPTLTGTVGDLTVTNPASADATWAQINGGDTLVSAAERTLVKAQ